MLTHSGWAQARKKGGCPGGWEMAKKSLKRGKKLSGTKTLSAKK